MTKHVNDSIIPFSITYGSLEIKKNKTHQTFTSDMPYNSYPRRFHNCKRSCRGHVQKSKTKPNLLPHINVLYNSDQTLLFSAPHFFRHP